MMNLSLKTQILLLMVLTSMVSFVVLTVAHYHSMRQGVFEEHSAYLQDIHGVIMATSQAYQDQLVHSGLPLDEKSHGFLPPHALTRLARDFKGWSRRGVVFRHVFNHPGGPENTADPAEMEALAWFREHPQEQERMVLRSDPKGRDYYHYTMPIYVEEHCLACHGNRGDASPAIPGSRGEDFGYQVGDLQGLMSIKMPTRQVEESIWDDVITIGVVYLFTLLGSLALIYLLLQRRILGRLDELVGTSSRVAQGDFDIRLARTGESELDRAVVGFNAMADALGKREAEHQRLQEEARRYLQQMESVLNNTSSIIFIKDTEGRYQFVNCMFETLFGVENSGVKGKRDEELFSPQIADVLRSGDEQALRSERIVELEEVLPREDGEHVYISVKFRLNSAAGEPYAVCGIWTDISRYLKMERTIRSQAAIWGSLMASTTEGIFTLNLRGECNFCNQTALDLLGFTDAHELLGKDLHRLLLSRRADGEAYPAKESRMAQAIVTGKALFVEDEVFWRADGQAIPVIYHVTPIREGEEITGAVVTFEEITERLEAQHLMEERLEELEQFNRLAVGRELKMVELKREINRMLVDGGGKEKYVVEE